VERDGNGWVECELGHRHWGLHGAAGLLLHAVDGHGVPRVLLQHRADWCHHGGTWGLPGGARDSHESVEQAALREAVEETAVDATRVRSLGTFVDDHGGWSYTTVYADCDTLLDTVPNEESADLEWVAVDAVAELPLHPGFSHTWPQVRLPPITVVIDAANVVGSTPNGWWKDRAGATQTWAASLDRLSAAAVVDGDLRGIVSGVHVILEGSARDAVLPQAVTAVVAPGSGDDALVDHLAELASGHVVVVTSDRALRERATAVVPDLSLRGPRWLAGLLTDA
jgi:8-oxo-dGTP pyrophosphatase MutT (NUDIX family)